MDYTSNNVAQAGDLIYVEDVIDMCSLNVP